MVVSVRTRMRVIQTQLHIWGMGAHEKQRLPAETCGSYRYHTHGCPMVPHSNLGILVGMACVGGRIRMGMNPPHITSLRKKVGRSNSCECHPNQCIRVCQPCRWHTGSPCHSFTQKKRQQPEWLVYHVVLHWCYVVVVYNSIT